MKLETFFEKFDQFADAPNAVEQMRALVLRLAMHGKISEADDQDVPVSVLLSAIEEEKERLGIKSTPEDSSEDFKSHEQQRSNTIPDRWRWVRFGDIARHNAGKTLDKGRNSGELRDYITTSNLYWGFFRLDEVRQMPIQADELDRCTARKGDLLICEGGEAGRAAVWPYDHEISFQNHVHRARFYGGVDPYFVQRFFETLNVTGDIDKFRKGVGISNMSGKALASIVLPLPPLAEQKRIVAKVDELMALCDRLEAQQQEREKQSTTIARASLARFANAPTPANFNFIFHKSYDIPPADLRKLILSLAVQGKLLPQDSCDTSASEMLASEATLPGGHFRRRKIMKRAPITLESEKLPSLPSSWEYATVQALYDLNIIVDYADGNHGSLYPRSNEFGDSGVVFVTARDIANGRVSWEGCARLKEDRAHQLTKGWAQGGDVLLTHNATVGRVARVEPQIGKFLLGTSATFYRLNETFIDRSYFYHVLCSPVWQNQLEAIMEQTTRNQVSIQKQAYFQVPIPPVAEQRRIVAKVDQLMVLVDELEKQLAVSRMTGEKLMEALVAEITSAKQSASPSVLSNGSRPNPGHANKIRVAA